MAYSGFNRLGPSDIVAYQRKVGSVSPTCHHHKWAEIDALAHRVQGFVQGDRFRELLSPKLAHAGIEGAGHDNFFADKKISVHMTGATLAVDIEGLPGRTTALSLQLLGDEGLNLHTDTSVLRKHIELRASYRFAESEALSHDNLFRLPYLLPFMESVDAIFGPGRDLEASFGPSAALSAREARLEADAHEISSFSGHDSSEVAPTSIEALRKVVADALKDLESEKSAKKETERRLEFALRLAEEKDAKLNSLAEDLHQAQTHANAAEQQLSLLQDEMLRLTDQLHNTTMASSAQLAELESANRDLYQENFVLKQKAELTQATILELEKANAQAEFAAAEARKAAENLSTNVEALEAQVMDLQEKARSAEGFEEALGEAITELTEKKAQLDGATKRAEAASAIADKTKKAHKKQSGNYEAIIAHLKSLLRKTIKERDAALGNYQEEEAKVVKLEAHIRELQSRLVQLETQPTVRTIERELTTEKTPSAIDNSHFLSEIEDLKGKLDIAQKELTKARSSARNLRAELDLKTQRISLLEEENTSLTSQVAHLKESALILKDLHQEEMRALEANLNDEIISYMQKADSASRRLSHAEQKLQEAQIELAELEKAQTITPEEAKALLQLRENYLALEQDLQTIQIERDEARAREASVREELNALSQQALRVQQSNLELEKRLETATLELEAVESRVQAFGPTAEDLSLEKERRINELEHEIATLRQRAADDQNQLDQAQRVFLETDQKLSQAQLRLEELEQKLLEMNDALQAAPKEAEQLVKALRLEIEAAKEEKKHLDSSILDLTAELAKEKSHSHELLQKLNLSKKLIESQGDEIQRIREKFEDDIRSIEVRATRDLEAKQRIIDQLQQYIEAQEGAYESIANEFKQTSAQKDYALKELNSQLSELQATLDGRLQDILGVDDIKELSIGSQLQLLQSKFEATLREHEHELQALVQRQSAMERAFAEERTHIQTDAIEQLTQAIPDDIRDALSSRLGLQPLPLVRA
jgi:chromosome segregation ATPase